MRLDPHSLLYAGAVQRTQGTATQGTDPGHGRRRMHNVASLTSEALCRHHPATQSGG